MKKKLLVGLALVLSLVATAGIAIAVDEATVQQIQTDAATAKNKAAGNGGKITGLYDNIENLQNQIDNIELIQGPPGPPGTSLSSFRNFNFVLIKVRSSSEIPRS